MVRRYSDPDLIGKVQQRIEDTLAVRVIFSPDNSLSDLRLPAGVLDPPFQPGVTAYRSQVASADSSVQLYARARSGKARVSMSVGGKAVPELPEPAKLRLEPGENSIVVTVTAQDGSTREYRLTVKRN